jgi:hypothetical protein
MSQVSSSSEVLILKGFYLDAPYLVAARTLPCHSSERANKFTLLPFCALPSVLIAIWGWFFCTCNDRFFEKGAFSCGENIYREYLHELGESYWCCSCVVVECCSGSYAGVGRQ